MEPEKPLHSQQHYLPTRPCTEPDFLLSRATGSVRTQGIKETFSSVAEAREALASGRADMIVGALPFTPNAPAALISPKHVIRSDAPLEPPAFFRGQEMRARIVDFSPSIAVVLSRPLQLSAGVLRKRLCLLVLWTLLLMRL